MVASRRYLSVEGDKIPTYLDLAVWTNKITLWAPGIWLGKRTKLQTRPTTSREHHWPYFLLWIARQFVHKLDKWLQKVTFQLIFASAKYSGECVQCGPMHCYRWCARFLSRIIYGWCFDYHTQGFIQDFHQGGANAVIAGLRGGDNYSSISGFFVREGKLYNTLKLGGSGGMLPQENLEICNIWNCFWWLLRPLTLAKIRWKFQWEKPVKGE